MPSPGSNLENIVDFNLHTLHETLKQGTRNLCLGRHFFVEWRNQPEGESETPVDVKPQRYESLEGLQLTTHSDLGWVRVFVQCGAQQQSMLALVQLVVRVNSTSATLVEPMWVETHPLRPATRHEIAGSRSRLTLKPNVWTTIQGVRLFDHTQHEGSVGFVMNIPQNASIDVAVLEISWLKVPDRLSIDLELLNTETPFKVIASNQNTLPKFIKRFTDVASALARLIVTPEPLSKKIAQLIQNPADASDLALLHLLCAQKANIGEILALQLSREQTARLEDLQPAEILLDAALTLREHADPYAFTIEDRLAFATIGQLRDITDTLILKAPRALLVTFSSAQPDDMHYWDDLVTHGLITGHTPPTPLPHNTQILHIASHARLSPISLAILRSVSSLTGGALISGLGSSDRKTKSWEDRLELIEYFGESEIIGELLPVLDPDLRTVSRTELTQTHPNLVLCKSPNIHQPLQDPNVGLDQAYAFIVTQPPDLDTSSFINIENCHSFSSLATLRAELSYFSEDYDRKPIIFLCKDNLSDPDYVISAVQNYWRYGASYVICDAGCDYDAASGHITLNTLTEPELTRLVLTATLCAMPTSEILHKSTDDLAQIDAGLFMPSAGFALALPRTSPLGNDGLSKAKASFNPGDQSARALEGLALSGPLDVAVLKPLVLRHWQLSSIIEKRLYAHKKTVLDMQDFIRDPSSYIAERVLDNLTNYPEDWPHPNADVDSFLLCLAQNPEAYLEQASAKLSRFLDILYSSAVAIDAAAALALKAGYICENNINDMMPLFEFLAICIPQDQMDGALILAADQYKGKTINYIYILSDCIDRYGSELVLFLSIMMLHKNRPDILEEKKVLSKFTRLMQSNKHFLFDIIIDKNFTKQITNQIDTITAFGSAVAAQDRETALALFADEDRLSSTDLRVWCDSLRPFSNELDSLSLPLVKLMMQSVKNPSAQKLAALIFRDKTVLAEMRTAGLLDHVNDLNSLALSELDDNAMLNTILKHLFENTAYTTLAIHGSTIGEVYDRAWAGLDDKAANPRTGPLVSVFMSAFNPDIALMRQSLRSLRSQTHSNIEIFIIDDCSDASHAAQIDKLVSSIECATLIRLDQNSGPYIGRNVAIEQANGAFIAIQDADDWSHPERFAAQLDAFDATPQARLVTTQHIRIDRTGKIQMEAKFSIFGDGTMTSLFRRDVFEEIGAFAQVRSRGDVEMRERIRSYYGRQAVVAIDLPMTLCLADSQTLSQVTRQRHSQHLQLFRSCISRRKSLARYRRDNLPLAKNAQLVVPPVLRTSKPGTVP